MNFLQYLFGIEKEDKLPVDKEDLKFRKELKENLTKDNKLRKQHIDNLNGGEEYKDFYKGIGEVYNNRFYGSAISYQTNNTCLTSYPNISIPGESCIGYNNSKL